MSDPRKEALKEGLRQLEHEELWRLIYHINSGKPLLLDRDEEGNANYSNGAYCPLAIAVGADEWGVPDNGCIEFLLTESCGFKIYNTRGIAGEFYTVNRREDLLLAIQEVLLLMTVPGVREEHHDCLNCGKGLTIFIWNDDDEIHHWTKAVEAGYDTYFCDNGVLESWSNPGGGLYISGCPYEYGLKQK